MANDIEREQKKKLERFREQIYGNPHWINGRMNRAAYFLRALGYGVIAGIVSTAVLGFVMGTKSWLGIAVVILFNCYIAWLILMLTIKRLHDLNLSGLWYVIPRVIYWILAIFNFSILLTLLSGKIFMPSSLFSFGLTHIEALSTVEEWIGYGFLALGLILTFKRGTVGVNRYGKDPIGKYEE